MGTRLAVLIGVVLAGAGCGTEAPAGTAGPQALTLKIEKVAALGGPGGGVAYGFGSIWVADPGGRVLRVDPATGRVASQLRVSNEGIVAAGAGGVWLPDFGKDRVVRIDPATGRVAARVAVGPAPAFVTTTEDAAWVTVHHGTRVDRIDAATGRVTRFRVGRARLERGGPQGVAVAGGLVWVGVPVLRQVIPIKGKPVDTTQEPCGALAAHGHDLWISPGMCGFRLMHVDTRRGRQVREIQLAEANVGDPVIAGRSLWITTADGTLYELHAGTGRRLATGRLGRDLPSLAFVRPGLLYGAGEDLVRITVRARDTAAAPQD